MANNLKRILAAVMAMSMTFSMLSVGAAATEEDSSADPVELESVTLPEGISVSFGTDLDEVLEKLGTSVQAEVKVEEDVQEPGSSEGTDPTEDSDSTEGTNPVEGSDSTEGTNPVEGSDSTEGTDPVEGSDSTEGTDPVDGTDSTESTDPVVGNETADSTEFSESTETTEDESSVENTDELVAVAVSYSGPETVEVPVTWSCNNYDGWTAGNYTFTATLDEGYTYNESLDVTVTVDAQATEVVARVGDTTYATLDEAVEQAEEGSIIELLANCKLNEGFNKTLTFTGNYKIRIDKQLTSNGEGWMCFGLYDTTRVLTFDGVEVEWISDGTAPWLMLSLSGKLVVTNGASLTFMFDSRTTKTRNAIYMNEGAELNVTNGSTFQILGVGTQGTAGQGIQLDKTGKSSINVTGGSTFLIDGTNRGYVNSPNIYVEDSTFTVQNCTSNASNGGNFKAVNSEVIYQNNAGHGLSAGNVILENSSLLSDNNGLYGIYVNGDFQVDGTSELTVTRNSYDGDYAGVNLTAAVTNGLVESGAVVTITGNFCSGFSSRGTCVFEEGAKLTITDNYNDKGSASYGGGIYNTKDTAHLTLPSDAVIYNNGAVTGGDDIYNTGTITFGKVGSDWTLKDCDDAIDGWYQDGAEHRWSAHSAPLYAYEFTGYGEEAVTGTLALKAAHGLIPVEPDDPEAPDWQISKSKTVTNLDDNYESQVTLALPAAGYERTMDVVLVIDDTHAGSDIFKEAADNLLDELAGKTTMDIKVGVVAFDAVSRDWLSATSNGVYSGLVSVKDSDALAALKTAVSSQLSYSGEGYMQKVGGTNTEWAVDMASDMLATGSGEDKYLIMFSDLYGYIYRGDLAIDGTTYSNVPVSKRIGNWTQGSLSMGIKYDNFADAYAHRNDADNQTVDGFFRDTSWEGYWSIYGNVASVPENTISTAYQVGPNTFSGFEKSLCLTYDNLAKAAGQAKVIIVNNSFPTGDAPSAQPMVQEMLDALEDGGYIKTYRYVTGSADEALTGDAASGVFTGIREDLIQLVDAGSKVVDVIGYGEDYNFDFVNDISKLILTVDGKELTKTAIDSTSYGFGGTGDTYDFVVTYYANGEDGKSDECFVWEINVPVTKDAPVELTYSVKLTNPQTASGTYGEYDEDGSKGYSGLFTNKNATLYPIDSNGNQGFPENFAKPTVSYTVSGGGGSSYDYYKVTVNYYDEDGNEIASSYTSPSIREGRDWDYSSKQLETITVGDVTYTFSYADGDPITGTNIRRDQVVDLYYAADSDIDDGDTPLGPGPDGETDPGDGTEPGDGDGTDIVDPDTPMGNLPQTGVSEAVNPYMTAGLMALAAAMTMAGLYLSRKRGKREEQ